MSNNKKEAPEFVPQEQLNDNSVDEIIEKIMSNDVLVDAIFKRIVNRMESTSKKRN